MAKSLADDIDAILPQTQCTQCGYNGCRPYAEAIANGAAHNQCPPGGDRVISELSHLLDREPLSLNPDNGVHQPKHVAFIREAECIGCTKCIKACPVDAIVGSGKLMHTVITDECTGCELCVEPCPVDCIDLIEVVDNQQPELMSATMRMEQSDHYRQRHQTHQQRLRSIENSEMLKHRRNRQLTKTQDSDRQAKQDYIAALLAKRKP